MAIHTAQPIQTNGRRSMLEIPRFLAGSTLRVAGALMALGLVACGGSAAGGGTTTPANAAKDPQGNVVKSSSGQAVSKEAESAWKEALASFEAAEKAGWNEDSCDSVSSEFGKANKEQGGRFAEAIFMSGLALDRCRQSDDAQKRYNEALEIDPKQCGARVRWQLLARSGVSSAACLQMLESEFRANAEIAVVVLGVNDVVEQVPSQQAVRARESIANRLRNAHGVGHVVFAPLPPVGRFPGLPQPLRWVAGSDARRHDKAVAAWAASRDDVSHVPIHLPLNRGVMAQDGFHPGEAVYRVCGVALAEHIATRVWPLLRAPARRASG